MTDKREARFLAAHARMVDDGKPIPHHVLRDFLDWQQEAKQAVPSDRAMREITVTGQWVEHLPQPMRRDMVKDIFSLAAQFGWTVRVSGQHWERDQQT